VLGSGFMKKLLGIMVLSLLLSGNAHAFTKGVGEVKMTDKALNHFIDYVQGKSNFKKKKGDTKPKPSMFILSSNGSWTAAWFCPYSQGCVDSLSAKTIKECERETGTTCGVFAARRTIYWDNGINTNKKKAKFKSKMSGSEIRAKLTDLGFIGSSTSAASTTTPKITKKKTTKKKVNGKRPIAISWDGYEDLILGTVASEETDDGQTIVNLQLPKNNETCEGSYYLQKSGKGTWQITCTNNLGAAGTLKHNKDGSVTGVGRDYNDKKVRFTIPKNS
jgi:hypothetical protein